MKQDILKKALQPYLIFYPNNASNNVFTPKQGFKIKFRLDGGIIVDGRHGDLEIYFDWDNLSIFELRKLNDIIRTSWDKIVTIEIFSDKDQNKNFNLLNIEPERRN